MADFRVFGIMLVKNEADIVALSIGRALDWCDTVFVYDTGSSDSTWSIVEHLAASDHRIVPFACRDVAFSDSLRGEIFRACRDSVRDGDWWCRLDADEIYIDEPKSFLRQVPRSCHVVWSIHHQYVFTTRDIERFDVDAFTVPVLTEEALPRHYVVDSSEARFFRHRSRLHWPENASWPRHMGVVYPHRIRLKHFQYRSPQQIQIRLDTRREADRLGYQCFKHSLESSWREKVAAGDGLSYDANDGNYHHVESKLPRHLESPGRRLLKRALHATGVWP